MNRFQLLPLQFVHRLRYFWGKKNHILLSFVCLRGVKEGFLTSSKLGIFFSDLADIDVL